MSQGYTLMKRIGKGAGHAPRSVDMQKSQTKQLLFLYVKFFLRDNAHVKQFLEFFEFISSGGLLNYSGAFGLFKDCSTLSKSAIMLLTTSLSGSPILISSPSVSIIKYPPIADHD